MRNDDLIKFRKKNLEDEEEFLKFLMENVDSQGASIINNPKLPVPLSKTATSYPLHFFSVSSSFKDSINKSLDLPKWNEITVFTTLRETMAQKLVQTNKIKLIRAKELFSKLQENEQSCFQSLHTSHPETLAKINTILSRQQSPQDNELDTMNASLFFTLLFTDNILNSQLQIDDKLIIGNALSMAIWKEQWETDVLLHPETRDRAKTLLQSYHPLIFAESYFTTHCLSDQISEFQKLDSIQGQKDIFYLSPWCGFHAVIEMLRKKKSSTRYPYIALENKRMKKIINDLLSQELQPILDEMNSMEKRKKEHQMLLLQVFKELEPIHSEDKEILKIKHDILMVLHANIILDSEQSLMLFTQQGIQFIHRMKDNEYLKKEIGKLDAAMKEYASSAISDVLSKSGEKLLQKTLHYFIFWPWMMRLQHARRGLFINMGMWLRNHVMDNKFLRRITQ